MIENMELQRIVTSIDVFCIHFVLAFRKNSQSSIRSYIDPFIHLYNKGKGKKKKGRGGEKRMGIKNAVSNVNLCFRIR